MKKTYTQLRAFHAVALHGNFTRAAESLNLSQPALSEQIKNLERLYGQDLFIRSNKKIQLTNDAKELLILTTDFFEAERKINKFLAPHENVAKVITVAIDSGRNFSRFLKEFYSRHSEVSVSIRTGNSRQCLNMLTSGEVDLAVSAGELSDNEYGRVILGNSAIVALVSRNHPFSARESIEWSDLAGQTLILREIGSETRAITDKYLVGKGDIQMNIMNVSGREAASDLTATGIGLSFISENEISSQRAFKILPITDMPYSMNSNFYFRIKDEDDAYLASFIRIINDLT